MYKQPGFTIDLHDSDGDSFSDGIFLFFGDTIIKVADNKEEFQQFLHHLNLIKEQLEEYQ